MVAHPQPLAAHRPQFHLAPFQLHFPGLSPDGELHQHPAAGWAPQGGGCLLEPKGLTRLAIHLHHFCTAGDLGFRGGGAIQRGDHNDLLIGAAQAQLQPNSGNRALGVGAQGGVVARSQQPGVGVAQGVSIASMAS